MTKDQLLKILKLSKEEKIPEKEACFKIMGKYIQLSYYKNKYGIKCNKTGNAPFTHRISRTHIINDSYFSNLSDENCYYAGFIAADGNINQDKTKLTITLSEKDKEFLQVFLDKLNSTYPIYEGISKKIFKTSTIIITSTEICKDLEINFNITPNKSLIYIPPELTNSFLDCFIMGLIDGDGTIGFSKRKKGTQDSLYISIGGTWHTTNLIKSRFEEILNKSTSNLYQKNKDKNFWTYRISDLSARTIFKYYYSTYNYLPTLSRKWNENIYKYCLSWKKQEVPSRQKGVNIFNLKGELIKKCKTLKEADNITKVTIGRISNLCNLDDSKHQSKGYMFSRTKEIMKPYEASISTNIRFLNKEQELLDKGEENIEDEA